MIGTYLKCDYKSCSTEVQVNSEGITVFPENWLIGHMKPAAFADVQQMHFCKPNCAWMHEHIVNQDEKEIAESLDAKTEEAA